jgi:hypothetical protein
MCAFRRWLTPLIGEQAAPWVKSPWLAGRILAKPFILNTSLGLGSELLRPESRGRIT